MKDVDYGYVRLKLKDVMEEQKIVLTKLACRAEMQRTQLKAYMNNEIPASGFGSHGRVCVMCWIVNLVT